MNNLELQTEICKNFKEVTGNYPVNIKVLECIAFVNDYAYYCRLTKKGLQQNSWHFGNKLINAKKRFKKVKSNESLTKYEPIIETSVIETSFDKTSILKKWQQCTCKILRNDENQKTVLIESKGRKYNFFFIVKEKSYITLYHLPTGLRLHLFNNKTIAFVDNVVEQIKSISKNIDWSLSDRHYFEIELDAQTRLKIGSILSSGDQYNY